MQTHTPAHRQHPVSFPLSHTPSPDAFTGIHLIARRIDMRTNRKFGILGQGLAVLTLTAALVGCGGSSDAGSPSGAATTSSAASATPSVAGTPATTVAINNRYSFQPTLTNPQSVPVSFSIQNKPVWATFAPTTGALSGVPSA